MNTISIRASKFRHIVGKDEQQRNCYNSVRLGSPSPDSNFIQANKKFLALPWQVKGGLCVVPLANTGAIDREDLPLILQEEEQNVNDFAFHPFMDNLVVTASQDAKAYLWSIPDEGLTQNIETPQQSFAGHRSRLMLVGFNNVASDVLVTVGADKDVKLWDVEVGEERLTLPKEHRELLASFSWSEEGSLLVTFCKDKNLRIFDPRANALSASVQAHEGTKGGRVLWLNEANNIFTTGFTRQSDREVKLWDPRTLDRPLMEQKIDTGSSPLLPYFDEDTRILYIVGKGDGLIRMFELTDDAPYLAALTDYKSSKPTTGVAFLPKSMCDVMECEISRILKLTPNEVIPISFSIPRQNKMFFQEDLFPPTWDGKPSATASEWFGGAVPTRNKVSLEPAQE